MAMEKFHFTTSENVKITLPWPGDALRVRDLRALDKIDDMAEKGWATLEKVADEIELEKIMDMTARDFEKFMEQWQNDGKATVGESSGS